MANETAVKTVFKRGDVVQFKGDWGKEPTMMNTAVVHRVAKDQSWADVESMFGKKRVPNPAEHLKVTTAPIVVQFEMKEQTTCQS